MNPVIWAYSENPMVSNEVASAAVEVAKGTSLNVVVIEISQARDSVRAPGVKLILKGPTSPDVPTDITAEALSRAADKMQPSAVLVGATRNGREIASMLAAKLKVGCLSEASKLTLDGQSLVAERSAFGGSDWNWSSATGAG